MAKHVKKPEFDPEKSYEWSPIEVFEITGQQFASLYHALTQEMSIPGGAPLALKVEAYGVIMGLLKEYVEKGSIVEKPAVDTAQVKQLFNKS